MSPIKKILVPLDFSNADVAVLRFLELLQQTFLPDSITFLHVKPALPALQQKFYDGIEKSEDLSELKQRLQEEVELHFEPKVDLKLEYVVKKGVPFTDTFKYQEEHQIDLIIVGWKANDKSSGTFARNMALNADCSVLTVPALKKYQIQQILLPIDFSESSIRSFELAFQINHHFGDIPLLACHVIKDTTEINEEAEKNQRKQIRLQMREKFEEIIDKLDKGAIHVDLKILKNKEGDSGYHIYKYARKSGADLIIAGVERKTSLLEKLAGSSILEKLLYHNKKIPVLILRDLDIHS